MKRKNKLTKLIEQLFGTRQICLNACSSALIIDVPESHRAIQNYVADVGRNAVYLDGQNKGKPIGKKELRTNTQLYILHDFRDGNKAYINTGELYPGFRWDNPVDLVVVTQLGEKCRPEDPDAHYSKRLDDFVTADGRHYEGRLVSVQGRFGFTLDDSQREGLADVIRKIGTEKCVGDHPIIGDTAKLRGVLEEFVEKYGSK